ncbi:ATP-binding cassette domain-containing protein [Ferribacterium limneticum]|uniref:ATP-binding cassette domain-containing protein n=1 Tax=Ferribacterium limneticum TaxID=76259 RepID=UPI00299D78F2|nr:ATP-binding cassette domain-containing protein [Ferribacterium limneticum]UCV28891.1 ATP-binding cassette domain-containing protein [Ferribacterium limneticum]UCV32809.1 ATP-binding cassette domain-containing protein [Ferribacterium limneticum]
MEALRIITEEHQNLWRIATTLDMVADEIDAGSKVETPFFTSVFDYIEQFMDRAHHAKEDEYLFRLLRERSTEAGAILDRLQAEHRNGPENLKDLRAKLAATAGGGESNAAFTGALRNYTAAIKSHVRSEEKDAMPLAREVLTTEDWAEIDKAFLDNDDPLFGSKARAEFRELFHRIASLAPESIGLGAHSAGSLQPGAGPAGGDVLLSVKGMESCYGRIKALKGIDLEVRKGELVALVGANGAGKTTFLRTLSGVQPMSAGKIMFDGEDISHLRSDLRMRRGICQSPEGRQVFGPLSIEDNLRLGAYTQPKHQVAEDMEKIYSMFPILKEKRNLPAGTLSGGQQQMLAIGRALMGRPKMLLLDEPSMGLAPLLVEEVFNVVKTLKSQGMTIFLVEQNAFAALAIADRGYVLETGNITLTGTGQELISNEQVRAAYLGM